ncbi:MAG: outer membrane lipoprotein carrier protein LolA [Treponema sp.]|nr:outer membrane lipoprotein carrier protein LolA [Treponema sp.]
MTKRGVSLFFLFIFSITLLFGQDIITAEKYLEMVSDTYSSIRDYEAIITIRSGSNEMIGNASYLTPNFLRIDFTRPAEQVIVFNGEALTVYLPEYRAVLNQAVNKRASGAGMASAQGLSLLRRNYVSSFLTGPNPEPLDGTSGERVMKLRLSRRTIAEGFRELTLSINPDTKLIRRIEGRTIAEGELRFDFTNIKTNVGIPEARFAYDTPASANMYNNFLFRDAD